MPNDRSTAVITALEAAISARTQPLSAKERKEVYAELQTFIAARQKRRQGPRKVRSNIQWSMPDLPPRNQDMHCGPC